MADGGIGESMLISAAIGAGSSMAQGKDPLKGAMMGGMMGGIGGAAGGMFSGAGDVASSVTPAVAPAVAEPTFQTGINSLNGYGLSPSATSNISSAFGPETTSNLAAGSTYNPSSISSAINPAASGATGALDLGLQLNPITSVTPNTLDAAPNLWDQAKDKWGGLSLGQKALGAGVGGYGVTSLLGPKRPGVPVADPYSGPLSKFTYDPRTFKPSLASGYAEGGITQLDPNNMNIGFAKGGIANLGGYSDGGQLLKGPGDGMSDSIPASIGQHQPAKLAEGEFVVPADVVSHLGNGSTDAGAKTLYNMMHKIRKARTGSSTQGHQISPRKFVPV